MIDKADACDFIKKHYRPGEYVYPGALSRAWNVEMKDVYAVLEECRKPAAIELVFRIRCPQCCDYVGSHYISYFDIPDNMNCSRCDAEIADPADCAVVVYRVRKNAEN